MYKLIIVVALLVMVVLIGMIACPILPTGDQLRHIALCGPTSSTRMCTCIHNLRLIAEAKDRYVAERGCPDGGIPSKSDIAPYIKAIDSTCFCPSALGTNRMFELNYKMNPVGKDPQCIVNPIAHVLKSAKK